MGDMGDIFNAMKEQRRELKKKWGIDCPLCKIKQPKRIPTVLLPQQKCRVCGYIDRRTYDGGLKYTDS